MNLFRNPLKKLFSPSTLSFYRDSDKLNALTEFSLKIQTDEAGKKIATGRSWSADELRFKSSEDLHKLWYVLLKEKNAMASDNQLKRKIYGKIGPQGRMSKCRVSMARVLTVINERKKIRDDYRKHLEEEYLKTKKEDYDKLNEEEQKRQELEPKVPKISFNLLRAKYHDLKRGVDNVDYVKEAVQIENDRASLKTYLDEKYDYKGKQIIKPGQQALPADGVGKVESSAVVQGFQSGIIEQLNTGRFKISQEEVLRSHVRNWKMLNLKQKRRVLGLLNARRASDSKKEFLKELNLLGQKIAYDNLQKNTSKVASA